MERMDRLEKESFFMTMSDGHEVYVSVFKPEQQTNKHIHLLHGMAEHSERYESFAQFLVEQGYFVSMHDHRGHGKTAQQNGQLGYLGRENGFERVVVDVDEILDYVREQSGVLLPVLFGHSMGSFIARRYMQLYSDKIDRVILSGTGSPSFLHKAGYYLAKQLVTLQGGTTPSKLMGLLSFGNFNQYIRDAKTPFDWLTTDEREVQKYIDDPLCGFISTTQFYVDLTGGMQKLSKPSLNRCIRSDLPILFVSGTDDPVGEKGAKDVLKAAQQLVEAGVTNILVHTFEGMRHEILNETNKQQVYEIILRWLKDEK